MTTKSEIKLKKSNESQKRICLLAPKKRKSATAHVLETRKKLRFQEKFANGVREVQ